MCSLSLTPLRWRESAEYLADVGLGVNVGKECCQVRQGLPLWNLLFLDWCTLLADAHRGVCRGRLLRRLPIIRVLALSIFTFSSARNCYKSMYQKSVAFQGLSTITLFGWSQSTLQGREELLVKEWEKIGSTKNPLLQSHSYRKQESETFW